MPLVLKAGVARCGIAAWAAGTLIRRARAAVSAVMALAALPAFLTAPAMAQDPLAGKTFIRDAEIEQLLREYSAPIFRAAGLNPSNTKILLIGERVFNAFVADGKRIFMNTGVLMDAATPNEVIGVLAHESGHIAGGHLARMGPELLKAQILSGLGTILGAGAVIGGARTGTIGGGGGGVVGIGSELGRRSFLAYARGEEQAADQAAVRFLDRTGQSANGMLVTFKRFSDDSLFARRGADPYVLSHPLPPERIGNLETVARQSPNFGKKDSAAQQARHDLMRAKLFGFTGRADEVYRRYPASDNSLAARYARAIVAYQSKRIAEAQAAIDGLIRERPNNPYFWELKGQALLENARAVEAVAPLRKAAQLSGGLPLIRILLGHALVSTENPRNIDEAISTLSQAIGRDPDAADGYRFLARAYAAKGNEAMAALTTAQGYYQAGAYDEAARQARRAQGILPQGSSAWLKADDIISARPAKDE
jgi:predicted Zn-dependent protease